jgi:hypothetical protein
VFLESLTCQEVTTVKISARNWDLGNSVLTVTCCTPDASEHCHVARNMVLSSIHWGVFSLTAEVCCGAVVPGALIFVPSGCLFS